MYPANQCPCEHGEHKFSCTHLLFKAFPLTQQCYFWKQGAKSSCTFRPSGVEKGARAPRCNRVPPPLNLTPSSPNPLRREPAAPQQWFCAAASLACSQASHADSKVCYHSSPNHPSNAHCSHHAFPALPQQFHFHTWLLFCRTSLSEEGSEMPPT